MEPIDAAIGGLLGNLPLYAPVQLRGRLEQAIAALWNNAEDDKPLFSFARGLAAGSRQQAPVPRADQQRVSLFSQFDGQAPARHYIPLESLQLKESVFRVLDQPLPAQSLQSVYRDHWEAFITALASLQSVQDKPTLLEMLQSLQMQYLWCVPMAADEDVSLYDYNRTSAALAACMAEMPEESFGKLEYNAKKGREAPPLATLVHGDISGVQKFLYTLTAKSAAKQLRARSVYLQMLTEVAARRVLKHFGMPITNLLYAGGGNFYLLLPANIDAELDALQTIFDQLLLEHHDGELYLALGGVSLQIQDFDQGNISGRWAAASQATSRRKRRRFASVGESVFAPRPFDDHDELTKRLIDRDESDSNDSALRASLTQLGKGLPRADALLLLELDTPIVQPAGDYNRLFMALGYAFALTEGDNLLSATDMQGLMVQRAVSMKMVEPPTLTDAQHLEAALAVPVAAVQRYTVNVVGMKGQRPTEFNELQDSSEGLKRFAVLRMDVDNLGQLFKSGLRAQDPKGKAQVGQSRATLARVASLSFAMSLFFEGWVGELCRIYNAKHNTSGGEPLYTVYAGGDDLFIVGRWNLIPELAKNIQDDFKAYAANHPSVHLSGGITLHGGKYPLYQAAEEAGDALSEAKKIDGKNAISFLGYAQSWESFDQAAELQDEKLYQLVKTEGIPRSLYQEILGFYEQYMFARKERERRNLHTPDQWVWGAWLWQAAYQLSRFKDRYRNSTLLKTTTQQIQEHMATPHGIELVAFATRWAEARTRPDSNKG